MNFNDFDIISNLAASSPDKLNVTVSSVLISTTYTVFSGTSINEERPKKFGGDVSQVLPFSRLKPVVIVPWVIFVASFAISPSFTTNGNWIPPVLPE